MEYALNWFQNLSIIRDNAEEAGSPYWTFIQAGAQWNDAKEKIDALRAVHTTPEFEKVLYRAFARTGNKVKTILRKELPKEYNVTPNWVGSQVGTPKTTIGGGGIGVSCSIPITGVSRALVLLASPRGEAKRTVQIIRPSGTRGYRMRCP